MFSNCLGSSNPNEKSMNHLFFKAKVFCGKPCEKYIDLLKSNNIEFTIDKIETQNVNGELLSVQNIYVSIKNNNEFMLFNKISDNKNLVYKICSVKLAHKYYITYMLIDKTEDESCAKIFDNDIIGEYYAYSSAMKAYKIACTVHNDETIIGVVHDIYDAETSHKADKVCIFNELLCYHCGDE